MDDSEATARKRAFDRKRQRELRAAARAQGRKQALVELPTEQLAFLDQVKTELGVRSRSDALERVLAVLAAKGPSFIQQQENGVPG